LLRRGVASSSGRVGHDGAAHLRLLGSSPEVSEQFCAISAERKVEDPLIQMIQAQRIE
jgi:hypothetical protein